MSTDNEIIQGIWTLAPEAGAFEVGPTPNSGIWWSNSEGDVEGRWCLFDDLYVFNANGSFSNVHHNETWIEQWQGSTPESCGAPVAPHDGSAVASYTYDGNTVDGYTVTINGVGAYLGIPKVHNSGELSLLNIDVESITYDVTFSEDNETMTLVAEVVSPWGGGYFYWTFTLELVESITPHFVVDIEDTGVHTLFTFDTYSCGEDFPVADDPVICPNSFDSLEEGDELGLFDQDGIIDGDGQIGEVLVGTGEWGSTDGSSAFLLPIQTISSVDLSSSGGQILPGSVDGNTMSLRVWDISEEDEYDVSYTLDFGDGTFGNSNVISGVSIESSCTLDECGVCDGDNSSCTDQCGVVNGDDSSCADCANVPNGDAVEDDCETCDNNPENDCVLDCAGTVDGDATTDDCGFCDDDNTNNNTTCEQDCAGNWGGSVDIGDVNGDGSLDIADIQQTVEIILDRNPAENAESGCADINGDGGVGLVDVVKLVQMVLNEDMTEDGF